MDEALDRWPELPFARWEDTQATLHMWCQVVGKVKLKLTPFLNEWWNVALFVTARGMTTGLIPYGRGAFQVDFDFMNHSLAILTDAGVSEVTALGPRSVAEFYRDFMARLKAAGIDVAIDPVPTEVPAPVPFDVDHTHASYDADSVNRFWRILLQTDLALQRFRSSFVGKSSPIHFFWGSFDLAYTRFSGRPAPKPEGAPHFFQLAEDQENIAFGFWPGNANMAGTRLGEPAFYSYIYPAPGGYSRATVHPAGAHFNAALGEFILPYGDVRQAASPNDHLLTFFQSAYQVAADLAGWDRPALERQAG